MNIPCLLTVNFFLSYFNHLKFILLFQKMQAFVWISPHMIGTDNKYFKDAKEFKPERWIEMENPNSQFANDQPSAFFSFGFGPRSCIGVRMAQLEAKIILCKFLQSMSSNLLRVLMF